MRFDNVERTVAVEKEIKNSQRMFWIQVYLLLSPQLVRLCPAFHLRPDRRQHPVHQPNTGQAGFFVSRRTPAIVNQNLYGPTRSRGSGRIAVAVDVAEEAPETSPETSAW